MGHTPGEPLDNIGGNLSRSKGRPKERVSDEAVSVVAGFPLKVSVGGFPAAAWAEDLRDLRAYVERLERDLGELIEAVLTDKGRFKHNHKLSQTVSAVMERHRGLAASIREGRRG